MRHSEPTPDLRRIRVEGKDAVSEIAEEPAKPTLECLRLLDVASMPMSSIPRRSSPIVTAAT